MDQGERQDRHPGYRNLLAWQRGIDLAEAVYRVTRTWPKDELFGLTSQVRRAAVSVPANVAEGRGRGSSKEFARFLQMANASLWEVETHLVVAQRVGFLSDSDRTNLDAMASEIGRLLNGLIRAAYTAIREESPTYESDDPETDTF